MNPQKEGNKFKKTTRLKRLLNLIIDTILIYLFFSFVFALFNFIGYGDRFVDFVNSNNYMISIGVIAFYYLLFESFWFKTPAKVFTETVVKNKEGEDPEFNDILIRTAVRFIPFEHFSFLFSKRPSGWHDRWSKTIVVEKVSKEEIKIIKVDENDKEIGEIGKMEAHKKAVLHRAFSIFIFNKKGEVLLQRRADSKYHGGGLWSNACCSHPTVGGNLKKQAQKRLDEEMGFIVDIKKIDVIQYRAKVGELVENEVDHIFIGEYEGGINPDPKEVSDYKWIGLKKLEEDLKKNPKNYTPWFKILYSKLESSFK